MPKCTKVKNPCKICLGPVSQKTGLQCQGACQSWVHYACINYTPGRIRDIKAGIITVNCPCPDCRTTLPKEFITNAPYSCDNMQCPANIPPSCENNQCPTNKRKQNQNSSPQPIPCPINKCGTACKPHSTSNQHVSTKQPCAPPESNSSTSSSDACLGNLGNCSSGCSMPPGDMGNNRGIRNIPSMSTMEQMYATVGELTTQINELMEKMRNVTAFQSNQGQMKCQNTTGPKMLCPKPCNCPSNPKKR